MIFSIRKFPAPVHAFMTSLINFGGRKMQSARQGR